MSEPIVANPPNDPPEDLAALEASVKQIDCACMADPAMDVWRNEMGERPWHRAMALALAGLLCMDHERDLKSPEAWWTHLRFHLDAREGA